MNTEKKKLIRNDVEEGKVPFRDVLVTVRGTRMKFDFKGLSRERMGYDVLLNMLKKDLRLRPNEVVDLEWWNDPCCPEWLTNDGQFFEFWDKAEPDSNGWINLQLQVHKVDENGRITEDGPVPPHYYCTPKKSPHIKKTVSKRQPNSTRKSPRLAAKSLQSQCASNSKRTLFVELENDEVYVPQAPTQASEAPQESQAETSEAPQASQAETSEVFDHDYWFAQTCLGDEYFGVQLNNIEEDECHPEEDLRDITGYDSEDRFESQEKEFLKKVVRNEPSSSESEDGDPTFGEVEVENDNEEDHYGDLLSSENE
ncbi:hypothetical protein MKW94_018896, partial [Papaver nudicaule]|nr:hypothetical protein [Papaver nudicaule]